MRFHVLGMPYTKSTKEYCACRFTQKVVNFCKMMTEAGHEVIHYGVEGSHVQCTENIDVVSSLLWNDVYGQNDWRKNYFSPKLTDLVHTQFIKNSILEIRKRVQSNEDLLICFNSMYNKPIAQSLPQITPIEAGIGYRTSPWARFKIFESYSILNAHSGTMGLGGPVGTLESAVIYNFMDKDDFVFRDYPDRENPYFLFVGRIIADKGIRYAIEVTKALGMPLKIAGVFDPYKLGFEIPSHVEFVGFADIEKRAQLMSGATALLAPSVFHEPFGNICAESMMCGTPVLTTDLGAFSEYVLQGQTGYRTNWFKEMVDYANKVQNIDRHGVRDFALNQFTLEIIRPKFEQYFERVLKIKSVPPYLQRHMPSDFVAEHLSDF